MRGKSTLQMPENIMKCTALSIDEVMAWIDVFCASTGTKPSHGAQVYAEMGLCKYFEDIVAQVVYRAYTLTEMTEEELDAAIEEIRIDCFERLSDDAQDITLHHLVAVLIHHGIRKAAAHQLMHSMNPLSQCAPKLVIMDQSFIWAHQFNEDSYYDSMNVIQLTPNY
jgi:hypothetical protein